MSGALFLYPMWTLVEPKSPRCFALSLAHRHPRQRASASSAAPLSRLVRRFAVQLVITLETSALLCRGARASHERTPKAVEGLTLIVPISWPLLLCASVQRWRRCCQGVAREVGSLAADFLGHVPTLVAQAAVEVQYRYAWRCSIDITDVVRCLDVFSLLASGDSQGYGVRWLHPLAPRRHGGHRHGLYGPAGCALDPILRIA